MFAEEEVKDTDSEQEIVESSEVPKELESKTDDKSSESETTTEPELSKREQLYKQIADKGPDPGKEEEKKDPESEPEEQEKPEVDSVQEKINKRIGKEVAKRKSAEERLADLEAENVRLKEKPDDKIDEKKEPTDAQIDAAYEKALEDGDHKYATEIMRYSIEKARKDALAEAKSENNKISKANDETRNKWVTLIKDNTVYSDKEKTQIDFEHPLNLNNQNSALYKTSMSYMQDKELSKSHGYDNSDKILGFRLAVNDARRDLMELVDEGKLSLTAHKNGDKTKKEKLDIKPKQSKKSALAIPTTESSETETVSTPRNQSDKAHDEISRRTKLKEARMAGSGS